MQNYANRPGQQRKGTGNVEQILARKGAGGVTSGDVGNLVGHDAGEFRFTLGGEDKRAIHI